MFTIEIIENICDPLYENLTYSATKIFLSYGYSLVEETFLFLKRPRYKNLPRQHEVVTVSNFQPSLDDR